MLFNSYIFLFGFLPLTLIGYQIAAHWHRHAVLIWLTVASLAFYTYWRPAFVIVLGLSVLFNYGMGSLISRRIPNRFPTQWLLGFAIFINLAALCYYKYLFPLLGFLAGTFDSHTHWSGVVLPLGISFFTFTQIAYLVDLQEGGFKQHSLVDYTFFATFFPHLIAGPILHHAEIMPQLQGRRDYRLRADDLAVGFAWFIMGLLKKVLLADRFASGADTAFATPHSLGLGAAWAGSLSYALELYFDFSGYSDMALGLARMFSIDFPLNFSSPYKAGSIIDFWQRWHMTLTRYITMYVYNPLAVRITRWRVAHGLSSSRKAMATPGGFVVLIAVPTVITMFVAGVWHGAGLQFILFGLLHGFYLVVNHAWRILRRRYHPALASDPGGGNKSLGNYVSSAGSCLLTFTAVLFAQVFFRAANLGEALAYGSGLLGLHTNAAIAADALAYHPSHARLLSLAAGLIIVWCLPNTQQILANFKPSLEITTADRKQALIHFTWRPTAVWGFALGIVLFLAVIKMQDPSTFLYFQF